ncbi:MAG: choice-of-anchor Q domain-containing protein [Dokdonella sp.]
MKSLAFPIAIFLIADASAPVYGAQFCVHNSDELSTALATASTNGEDDNIKLAPGIYSPPGSLGFTFYSSDLHGLTIGGGFDTPTGGLPCSLPLGGAQSSVIDGAGITRLLDIALSGASAAPVFLHDLTLRNGSAIGSNPFMRLSRSVSSNGSILIENVAVRDVHAESAVARVQTSGIILVRSSEFIGNTVDVPNGTVLDLISDRPGSGGSIFFNNNTVAGNSVPASSPQAGVVFEGSTSGDVHAANNILWNNGGVDIRLGESGTIYLDHNDIGSRNSGSAMVNESTPFHVDPKFVSAINVHLMSNSPLRDAGVASPIGGSGNTDLGGGARVVFGGVDLGAYEIQDRIFMDGFE